MILIWRGFGFMVPFLFIVGLITGDFVVKAAFGEGRTYELAGIPVGLGLAAALVFVLAVLLERTTHSRTVVDKETGAELILRAKHDFFFLPMKFWSCMLVLAGVYCIFF